MYVSISCDYFISKDNTTEKQNTELYTFTDVDYFLFRNVTQFLNDKQKKQNLGKMIVLYKKIACDAPEIYVLCLIFRPCQRTLGLLLLFIIDRVGSTTLLLLY